MTKVVVIAGCEAPWRWLFLANGAKMAYCTVEQVRANNERIPESGDQDSVIAMHIQFVDAYIDGKIRGKVELPFAGATPPIIEGIALDLATYRSLRSLFGAQSEEFQLWIQEYKTPAEEMLQKVADCEITLDPDLVTTRTRIVSSTAGKEAIFSLDDPYDQDYHPTDDDKRYGED